MGRKVAYRFWEDEHAVCPFYKKESAMEIRCIGLCSGTATQNFKTGKQKDEHKYSFCCGLWETCEHSIALSNREEYEGKAGCK